jgi:hypothetical protein
MTAGLLPRGAREICWPGTARCCDACVRAPVIVEPGRERLGVVVDRTVARRILP